MFLHPVVSGGTDWLPHLPDLSQPDHQRGCKYFFYSCCFLLNNCSGLQFILVRVESQLVHSLFFIIIYCFHKK